MESNNLVIGISGLIASGKTSFAKVLSKKLHCHYVSFGNYVRKLAKSKGIKQERVNLQELGESLIMRDLNRFCEQTLKQSNWVDEESIIIEGIRHVSVLEYFIKKFGEDRFKLIYIDTPKSVRKKRFEKRNPQHKTNFGTLNTHSTEIEIESGLKSKATIILDGNNNLNSLVDKTIKTIQPLQRQFNYTNSII